MMYIPMDELQDGHLYRINARNAEYGIWVAKEKGFMISRVKFNANFPFVEYHWDTGAPYGTVKPYYGWMDFKVPFRNIRNLVWIDENDPKKEWKRKKEQKLLRYLNIFEDREWKRKLWDRELDKR